MLFGVAWNHEKSERGASNFISIQNNRKQSKTSIDLFSLQNGKPPKSIYFVYIDVHKPQKHYKMGNLQFEAIFAYLENVSSTKWGTSLAHPDKPHCAAQKNGFVGPLGVPIL